MKKDWKYILYLSLAFGLFLAVKLTGPKEYDWTPTYAVEDKNPYGAIVLRELLPELFQGKRISVTNKTIYELKDSLRPGESVMILTQSFNCGKEDAMALLDHAGKGANVFIGAQTFFGKLADTLKITTNDYLFELGMYDRRNDTSFVHFVNSLLDTTHRFAFKRDNVHHYFGRVDSTHTTVIAENDFHHPVTVRTKWGKGNFILNSTPLAFTNIYTLKGDNYEFVSTSLSYLPVTNVHWTEFYSVGRMEARTPLRFILTHQPLAWAYYITIICLLLFMIFEAKRKQRVIPIVQPLENTSLEFVGTIGNLYYHRGDHKNIAEKKIVFFFDQVRTRYLLNPNSPGEDFIPMLAKKSGKGEPEVRQLFLLIESLRKQASISKEQLIELNKMVETFSAAR